MQLYIANVTQQNHEFMYRVPRVPKLIIQPIRSGGQIRISAKGGDLNRHDVDSIMAQHEKYGMVAIADVGKIRGRLCPLIASTDRPVPQAKMIEQIRANRALLEQQGRDARTNAAVAVNHALEENIQNTGSPDVLRQVELSVEEIKPTEIRRGANVDAGLVRELETTAPLAEGIRVSRDTQANEGRRPARRRVRL